MTPWLRRSRTLIAEHADATAAIKEGIALARAWADDPDTNEGALRDALRHMTVVADQLNDSNASMMGYVVKAHRRMLWFGLLMLGLVAINYGAGLLLSG